MTPNELRAFFNKNFGLNSWPEQFKVDADTYAQCCQEIFNHHIMDDDLNEKYKKYVTIILGPTNGLMFKGVELILEILPE